MKDAKTDHVRYIFPEKTPRKQILDALKNRFTLKATGSSSEHVEVLDSFEWGFYQNAMTVFRYADNNLRIWNAEALFDPDHALTVTTENPRARFWWDYQESQQRQLLQEILKLRALLRFGEGVLRIEHFNLQDGQGKTLVFAHFVAFYRNKSARIPLFRQMKLTPLTGYREELAEAVRALEEVGGFKPSLNPVDSLFSAIGVVPEPYTVKPDLKIEPDMPARAAASSIIATMIEKQRLTEQGVIDDIDTEFLHHFRVALRMTRAAVAQLKEVFPEQDVLMLKERFGALGRETNHLRDLDVFILDKDRYMSLLPDSLAGGLVPMFDDFEKERAQEVKRIAKWLRSAAYRKEISDLQSLFEKGYSASETLWSEKPAIELAVGKIMKRYNKIRKSAAKITSDTPDEAIHSIRIDCKKLRYLLYFFGNLFDKKQLKKATQQLKSLQDKLGVFNDLSVQGEYLEGYLDEIEHKAKKDIFLIAALGGLIATLYRMQKLERENSIAELQAFSTKKNVQLFREAFAARAPDA